MKEYRDIVGYEGIYKISSCGTIMSYDKEVKGRRGVIKSRELKTSDNGKGYRNVMLFNNGRKMLYVHRLVAEAFIEKVEGKDFVNHKDGNKSNNNVDNLEWCNRSENMLHANSIGLCNQYDRNGNKNPATKIVLDISTGVFYETMKEAANLYKISVGFLSSMLNNKIVNKTNLRYV